MTFEQAMERLEEISQALSNRKTQALCISEYQLLTANIRK